MPLLAAAVQLVAQGMDGGQVELRQAAEEPGQLPVQVDPAGGDQPEGAPG